MFISRHRSGLPSLLHALVLLSLLALAPNAWAISVTPSPSYSGSYTVSWSGSHATGCTYTYYYPYTAYECYLLEEKVGSGNWTTVALPDYSTSWAASGKTTNTYQYRIAFHYGVMYVENWSEVADGPVSVEVVTVPTTPPTPSGPSTSSTGAYTISWSAQSGAASYQLQERLSGSTWATIQSSSSTSRAISGKTSGTWQYRVRACNAAGCSSWSGTKSVEVIL